MQLPGQEGKGCDYQGQQKRWRIQHQKQELAQVDPGERFWLTVLPADHGIQGVVIQLFIRESLLLEDAFCARKTVKAS